MKKFMIYLSILMISNIYAQCDDYNEFNCSNEDSCEWVEDIETGNCGNLWGDDCELNPECNWNCDSVDDYMGWCTYSCDGGPYEIDNSYCQEIEMPECNEENEFQCNDGSCIPIHRVCNNFNDCLDGSDEINCEDCSELLESDCSNDNNCEWVENLEIENCYDILDCSGGCTWQDCEEIEGCNWHFGTAYYDPSYCYGEHEVDNSYCEEIEMPECSEMSETECSSDDVCEWIEDIEIGNCSVFDNSESSCTGYPGECYWDEDITYGSCNGYDNSQWACNNAQGCYWDCYYGYCGCNGQEITGVDTECIGQYEINNSYCEEAEVLECSGMNESQCNNDNICEWIIDYEWSTCSNYNSASSCSWANDNGGNCDWSWNSTEWQDTCSGGSFQLDLSYCEESEYQLGDLNQDSIINIQDIIIIINLILNGEFDLLADINLDSTVNVLDVIQLVNIILN
jgi:hypothetical protein